MIYCFGQTSDYEPAITRGGAFAVKQGVRAGYPGGAVFASPEEAAGFMAAHRIEGGRRVYGLDADWVLDTYQIEGEGHRRLLRDAKLVRLTRRAA